MGQTVIGIFKTKSDAQDAVDELLDDGFLPENVDVSTSDETGYPGTPGEKSTENESGITKFFKHLFGTDDEENERYTTAAKRGTTVTVHALSDYESARATEILDQYGAMDVDEAYGKYADTTTVASGQQYAYNAPDKTVGTGGTEQTIPIIEETLQVGKREIETGGVRLKSRIIEKPVEESLRLRQEHVRVERNKVDRPATDGDLEAFEEGTVELVERAEVPVVSKEARIVEEVTLSKEVGHRDETVSDTVRKTEVEVEELDNNSKK